MSIATFLAAKKNNFGKKQYSIRCEKDASINMKDNITLLSDIYFPKGDGPFPTILIRTPYLRAGFKTFAQIYAERGFITILQACRGTDGSEGEVDPLISEREDGIASLDWVKEQSWFDGRLGTTGPSYLGYVQWAICDLMPEKSALSTHIVSSEYRSVMMPKGAIDLQLWLSWMQLIKGLEESPLKFTFNVLSGKIQKRTVEAAKTLPLIEADITACDEKVPFWRDWMNDYINDEKIWKKIDCSDLLNEKTPPNFFVSGWYDFILDQLVRDYKTLKVAGNNPYLTIGPWFHVHPKLVAEGVKSTLDWMRAHLKDDFSTLRKKPVRIHISGLDQWKEYEAFPPPNANVETQYLSKDNLSSNSPTGEEQPSKYKYDPNDPTPNLGGAIFAFNGAGAKDNRELEARGDVIIFTGEVLTKPLSFIGQPKLTLFARSSLDYSDFFARLCDVAPNGKSINICDGFIRLNPDNAKKDKSGIWQVEIDLHNFAHQFKAGHRLRLQISSGAAPRFSRNPGTSESILTATELKIAEQEIFHNEQYPSKLELPIYDI